MASQGMRVRGFGGVLGVCVAAGMLAGCGGPHVGGPGILPPNGVSVSRAAHGRSWMLPEARSETLLYIGDPGSGGPRLYVSACLEVRRSARDAVASRWRM